MSLQTDPRRRVPWNLQYLQETVSEFHYQRSPAASLAFLRQRQEAFCLQRRTFRRKGLLILLARKKYTEVGSLIGELLK